MIAFLSDAEISSVLDPTTVYEAVLDGLRQQAEGRVGLSDPPSLLAHVPDGSDTLLQVKGAFVLQDRIVGLRVGGIRDGDSVDEGRLIVLYDVESLRPIAVLEESTIYRMRVGAELAATIAHLRPDAATRLAVIGSGRLARSAISVIDEVSPFVDVVVCSRTAERRESLVAELQRSVSANLTATDDVEAACRSADVILTITTATSPVVWSDWCRDGTVVVSAGSGLECDPALYERADRLVVDDWDQCMTIGDLAVLSKAGEVTADDVSGRLCDLVAGALPTGSDAGELVVAVPQGLTFLDLAVAKRALDRLQFASPGSVPGPEST